MNLLTASLIRLSLPCSFQRLLCLRLTPLLVFLSRSRTQVNSSISFYDEPESFHGLNDAAGSLDFLAQAMNQDIQGIAAHITV